MSDYHRLPGLPCKRQAQPRAVVLLFALLVAATADCTCGRSTKEANRMNAAASASGSNIPLVRQCYQGCLDLNKGKPVDQDELKKKCAGRCVEICSKACAVPRKETPREQAMEECKEQCKEQLNLPGVPIESEEDD